MQNTVPFKVSTKAPVEAVLVAANEGTPVGLGSEDGGSALVKVSPISHKYTHFAVVGVDLPKGGHLRSRAYELNERLVICFSGKGRVFCGGKQHAVSKGTFMFWGRGVAVKVEQEGEEPLRLSVISFPPGPDSRFDLFPVGGKGAEASKESAAMLGVEDGDAADGDFDGHFIIVQDDEGEEYWQAAPSLGYVSIMIAAPALPLTYFCAASQLLEPGANVRHHGHVMSEEIVIVTHGKGLAILGDVAYPIAEGDLIVLPPTLMHHFVNNGTEPLKYGGVFLPPSVEGALRETGVRKLPGAERPTAIPRNPTTEKLLVDKYGFIIPGI
ncbi:hypothetical protein GCM10007881_43150 [Mesorhizobium huakuii]|uniref:cupin domain-containing protein n=1 Tax=Mesorhizobium huakuii TaxID=28104 RepID=UPI00235DC2D3|nr:cupin domain-containing protein [Mesorhizobium huakuii]GLQ80796.1 hypothetical protein GCM10007881_43150 [Mesorhizobium huakuii]